MNFVKKEVKNLLESLPEDCTLEDVQHHLYVFEKIRRGIDRANMEGTFSHNEVEKKFDQWTS